MYGAIVLSVIILSTCRSSKVNKEKSTESATVTSVSSFAEKIPQDDPVKQAYMKRINAETVEIYADNDAINRYLNAYNAVNDMAITSDDIRIYYTHGNLTRMQYV